MLLSTSTLLIIVGSFARYTVAHTTVYAAWINDKDQGLGCAKSGAPAGQAYIRCPPNNNPVKDMTSAAVACNVDNTAQPKWLSVKPGDKFTFEWHHDSRQASDDIIASSHKGPALVYIAPAASNGKGAVWTKLWHDAGKAPNDWAVDRLIKNKGKHWIKIPNIPAGKYLLRPELLTLHESDTAYTANPNRGLQLYTECIQIEIPATAGGKTPLPAKGVSFPGEYKYSDPGIVFNLYANNGAGYKLPGPAPWSGYTGGGGYGSSGAVAAAPVSAAPISPDPVNPAPVSPPKASAVDSPAPVSPQQPAADGSSGITAEKYQQCGGNGFSGPTACSSGSTCQKLNDYYSQCL